MGKGNNSIFYTFYRVPQGFGAIVFDEDGISHLALPEGDRRRVERVLCKRFFQAVLCEKAIPKVETALESYFQGKRANLDFPLNLENFSRFERGVYAATKTIPYGEVRSYQWVADKIGRTKASRAVGRALGKNCIPVFVPCHRVVKTDGTLGGFNAGLDWKKKLLELEKSKNI